MSFVLLKAVVCNIFQKCSEVSCWGCVCHVSPVLGTSILPWQGLCSGCHCSHCSVLCLAPRAHCCSQLSPDPGRASLPIFWDSVTHLMEPLCLSPENMRNTTLPWMFVVAERIGQQTFWEAREEGNSSSVRQQG